MGRKPKFTLEERKIRDKELTRIRSQKRNEKIKSDPEQKKKHQQKMTKYLATIPQETKRKNSTVNQRNYRARRKSLRGQLVYLLSEILKIKSNQASADFQKALKAAKQFKTQVSCEQADQLEFE